MACPLLAGLGRDLARPAYIADAARQILTYSKVLQDEKAGLFYHMWDWQTKERTRALWARGNGWVLMSIADVVEELDRRDPLRADLLAVAQRMIEGLERTRDAAGMWHTVMDDPKSYPETSATAMFAYGVLKLIRLGALAPGHAKLVEPGWRTINEVYVKDGLVTGVSAGTVPKDKGYYKALPAGVETWGTGAYLMAASEFDQSRK
jgi:unsaturated rhamnogalacturonyl hydrolase